MVKLHSYLISTFSQIRFAFLLHWEVNDITFQSSLAKFVLIGWCTKENCQHFINGQNVALICLEHAHGELAYQVSSLEGQHMPQLKTVQRHYIKCFISSDSLVFVNMRLFQNLMPPTCLKKKVGTEEKRLWGLWNALKTSC